MPKSATRVESFVSPEEFRAAIVDVEKYPEFLPEVKKVVVRERSADSLTATFSVQVVVGGMEVNTDYTVRYALGEREISWKLVESETVTKNEGSWRLEQTEDGETRAFYENEITTSLPIPEEMQKLFADQELPKMMRRFRDRVEG